MGLSLGHLDKYVLRKPWYSIGQDLFYLRFCARIALVIVFLMRSILIFLSKFFGGFVWVVRPAGLEPATYGLEGCCSIQLSYGRMTE